MDHQDYTTINIGHGRSNKKTFKPIQKSQGQVYSNKIENEQENFKIDTIPKSISKQITNLRNSIKKTQKDMALHLQVQKNLYIEIENGKAKYNPETKKIIQKIQKVFGVKFSK